MNEIDNGEIISTIEINIYVHQINEKTLYSYAIEFSDGERWHSEFLYGSYKDALSKANGRLYGWLKNQK